MIRKLVFLAGALSFSLALFAQVTIGANVPPNEKSMLDIRSGSKGILIPRMNTTQRLAIADPIPVGLTVFDLSTLSFWYYTPLGWEEIPKPTWTISGSTISNKDNRSLKLLGPRNIFGNISFEAADPIIYAPSRIDFPGGAHFTNQTVIFESPAIVRDGIWNDTNPLLYIHGGTSGSTNFQGNVGILSIPATKLDILGGNWDLVNTEGDMRIGNTTYRLKIGIATGGGGAGATTIMQQGAAGGLNVLTLGSQGNNVLHINGNTNGVGIHNNNPLLPLSFASAIGGKISLYGNATTSHYGIGIQNGLFQIHTDLAGSNIAFGYGSSTNFTTRMLLNTGNGNLSIAGALLSNQVFSPSDITLKKDIAPIEDGLEAISQLNGYTYHWKNETSDPSLQSGVIAQEVQKVLPNLVQKNENGTLMVNYSGLIPYLIQGMKEQQSEIELLKKEIEELKKRLN